MLYNLERLPKDSRHFQALGDIDELSCHIGVVRQHAKLDERISSHSWYLVLLSLVQLLFIACLFAWLCFQLFESLLAKCPYRKT